MAFVFRDVLRTFDRPHHHRRRDRGPSPEVQLRAEWLAYLVEKYGPGPVGDWDQPPAHERFEVWAFRRASQRRAAGFS